MPDHLEKTDSEIVSFKALVRLYVMTSILMGFLTTLSFLVGLKKGDWSPFFVLCSLWTCLLLLINYFKLTITPRYFHYRQINANRRIEFGEIEQAYFRPVSVRVAHFFVKTKNGQVTQVNLRSFPIDAGAILFCLLDRYGIPIEVPAQHPHSNYLARSIREHQSNIASRWHWVDNNPDSERSQHPLES